MDGAWMLKLPLETALLAAADERNRRDQAERWAAALAQTVAATTPQAPIGANDAPPDAWRLGDGELTPKSGTSAQGLAPESSEASEPTRLALSVETENLGTLTLTVDRTQAGLDVVIGVHDSRAESVVEPERAALARALEASGLGNATVRIVHGAALGTVLAQARERERIENESAEAAEANAEPGKKNSKRLSLIG